MLSLTEAERAVLRIVQKNIPDSLTPYADIARACTAEGHAVSEDDVIQLLRRLKEEGVIRRYGAMIRHTKTDWIHNAMVAWRVPPDDIERCGNLATTFTNVSHVYHRPSSDSAWPYNLYTMVHGRTIEECTSTIEKLQETMQLDQYTVLQSVQELKKVSMTYFLE